MDLEVEEVEVELLAAGVCGTDILSFKRGPGSEGALPSFPIHECVGVVCRDPTVSGRWRVNWCWQFPRSILA
ncbi:MAG: alcohol dehydrogenase catalytic domain-containing protein [Pseudonocardiaceae bacterium]